MNREEIEKAVASLLPAEAFLSEGALGPWPGDVEPPAAYLAPGTEEEISLLLRRASAEGWRVLPAGAGSWLGGWGTPEVDLVVSTLRLREMGIYEPADLTFTAGAGIPVGDLHEATAANGQWLPLDPPGSGKGTLGALVANGVGGPLMQAYGAPRDHILGLTLVSGDGRILRWGGRVVKNVAGFDVTRLGIGSRGGLGIITSVSARLFPIPREDRTLLVRGPSAPELLPLARELARSSMPISALELVDPVAGLAGEGEDEDAPKGGVPEQGGGLVVRLLGTGGQLQAMEDRVLESVGGLGETVVLRMKGEESRSLHRRLEAWEEGAGLVLRLSLLPGRMGTLLEWSRELGSRMGLDPSLKMETASHVGWGVLRIAFRGRLSERNGWDAAARVLLDLRSRLEGEGGSLTVSQGPQGILREMGGPGKEDSVGALVRGLKKTFDPAGILAPGRFEV